MLLISCQIETQRVRVAEVHVESIEELRIRDPDVYDSVLKERWSTMETGFVAAYFDNVSSVRLFQISMIGPEQRANLISRLGVATTKAIYADLRQEPCFENFVERMNAKFIKA